MHYVYILRLINRKYYVGYTSNLKKRILEHKKGRVGFTKKYTPINLEYYCAFKDKSKATKFEKYLKSDSGFAFRNKHLVD